MNFCSYRKKRYWQTRTHCCRHIVAYDVFFSTQTRGTQNECCVSLLRKLGNICCGHKMFLNKINCWGHKMFLNKINCCGHKICVRNKCCARRQTGKHLCRQQCVRNNVSSFARALRVHTTLNHIRFVNFCMRVHINRYRICPTP